MSILGKIKSVLVKGKNNVANDMKPAVDYGRQSVVDSVKNIIGLSKYLSRVATPNLTPIVSGVEKSLQTKSLAPIKEGFRETGDVIHKQFANSAETNKTAGIAIQRQKQGLPITPEQKLALREFSKNSENAAMGFIGETGAAKETIEKKLEGLMQEARKYKSAEEFVKAQTNAYHGTPNKEFSKFELGKTTNTENETNGLGVWVTPQEGAAKLFSNKIESVFFGHGSSLKDVGGTVMPVRTILENPKIYESTRGMESLRADIEKLKKEKPTLTALHFTDDPIERSEIIAKRDAANAKIEELQRKYQRDAFEHFMDDRDKFASYIQPGAKWGDRYIANDVSGTNKKFIEYLKSQGHDGIIIKGTGYDAKGTGYETIDQTVVFDPKNVLTKSQLTDLWNQVQKETANASGIAGKEAQTALQSTTESAQGLPPQERGSTVPQTVPQEGGISSLPPSIPPSGKKSIGELMQGAVDRLSAAIRESAKPARDALEKTYQAERSKRTGAVAGIFERGGGQKGYFQALGKLKGELATPVQKAFEKPNIIEDDINTLFKMAQRNPNLDVFEKLNTQGALSKILTGIIPTESELSLLSKTYGDNLIEILLEKRSTGQKILAGLGQMANLPRSIMSSFDLSAPFRQGLALMSHPKAFASSFFSMFKQFGSEAAFKAVQEGIAQMPEYQLMKQGKLALTDVGAILTDREEMFMSNWAEKIPGIGKIVKASGRAYTGFLNKLRADVFTDIVRGVRASGKELDSQLVTEIADFVNTASGRGSKMFGMVPIGKAGGSVLNGLFFSPRLMASRTTLLNPVSYVTASPIVRKEMLKSLFTVLGSGLTVLGLAKMAGARVGTNPKSSDFGKVIVGNTRFDIWGGFQQYVRMAAQLWTGKYVSTTTGKETTLGEGYKPMTRFDILWRQIESKEAPIASFITALLKQQDYQGKPISVTNEIKQRFTPMLLSDLYDMYKDNPELLPIGLLGVFGVGTQTYLPQKGGFQSKLKTPIKTSEFKPKVKPFKSKLK